MDISIIIVNWQSAGYLAACIDSVLKYPPGSDWECIVIDNASYDGAAKLCIEKYPFVQFIQSDKNIGFAGANNRAIANASGEALLFLNPDTIVKPGALQTLHKELMGDPKNGAAGPRLLNADGSLQTTCVLPFPSILSELLDGEQLKWAVRGMRALLKNDPAPRSVEALSGASLMVRRTVFERVHGFSTDYFMYAEDIDLCAKIRKQGLIVKYVPQAVIVHLGGGSSSARADSFFAPVMIKESNRILLKKFRGALYALLYRTSMALTALLRLLLLMPLPASLQQGKKNAVGKWAAILYWSMGSKKWIMKA
jgi:GT2 family glycosyltransferase